MYTPAQIKEAGLDDFRVFLCQVWDHLGLPDPTPVQLDMARTLQHGPNKLVVQAFRGVGKSWITAAFVLWLLFLNPQAKILVVSANQKLADNFSIFCKSLIHNMPLLQHLAPHGDQRNSNIAFDVGPATPDPSPSVKSAGLGGQITGSRADYIIADDIEIPKNSYTHVLRERTSYLVRDFDAIIKPLDHAKILYLGTPQVEDSLYSKLPERGYVIRIWPSEIPENIERYGGKLAPFIMDMIARGATPGTPVEPKRFDRDELEKRRAGWGRSGYALQYLLDTNPSDTEKHPLKLRDLIIDDVDVDKGHVKLVWSGNDRDKVIQDLAAGGFDGDVYVRAGWKSDEMANFTGTVMAIDPSGMGKDETAYAIVRYLFGQLYLVSVGGFKEGFAETTLNALAAKALRHKVNYIICEDNYGGGMFRELLKPVLWKAGVKASFIDDKEFTWSRGNKELRILDVMEPLVQSHRLTVDRKVIEEDLLVQRDTPRYSFVQQFTRMERVKGAIQNDDRIEAVSMACSYWETMMARDKDKAHDDYKQTLLDAELRDFRDHVFGGSSAPLLWQ